MAGLDADIWVCGQCRSVNKLRAKQCYHCRTPQQLAAVDPADIAGTGHGALREIALPEFSSSRGEAMLASVLILLVAGMNIISTIVTSRVLNTLVVDPDTVPAGMTMASAVSLATLGIGLLALTGWAFWLSRVVSAMPALGLGYPAANAMMAFLENYLPGLNLFRVPAIVRDVVRRLEPDQSTGQGRGAALIFAAWIGLIGGFFVPRIGAFLGYGAETLEGVVGNALLVSGVAAGLVTVGAVFLVALIWWIEGRIARRRAQQLKELSPQTSPPPGPAVAAAAAAVEPRVSTPVGTPVPFDPMAAPFAPQRQTAPTPEPVAPAAAFAPTPGSSLPAAPATIAGPLGAAPAAPATDDLLHRPIIAVTGAASIPTRSPGMKEDHAPDVERFADARPAWPEPPTVAEAAPATQPAAAPEPAPVAWPEPAPVLEPAPMVGPPPEIEPETAHVVEPEPAPVVEPETAHVVEPEPAPVVEPPPLAAPAAEPAPAPFAHIPTGPRLHLRVDSATTIIATLDSESEAINLETLRAAAAALARADGSALVATTTNVAARPLAQQAFEILTAAQVPTTMEG